MKLLAWSTPTVKRKENHQRVASRSATLGTKEMVQCVRQAKPREWSSIYSNQVRTRYVYTNPHLSIGIDIGRLLDFTDPSSLAKWQLSVPMKDPLRKTQMVSSRKRHWVFLLTFACLHTHTYVCPHTMTHIHCGVFFAILCKSFLKFNIKFMDETIL
jgi:hypothetical protein